MDEMEMVRASGDGDLESFNQLVQLHQKAAYNLAYRMLGSQEGAEDVTQEAFLSAWRNLHRFRGGSFKAWLMQITANACRDELRRAKRRPAVPLESLPYDLPSTAGESPEEYAIRKEVEAHLQAGLASLSSEQRMALILCDVQGFSYEEAAGIMRCSLGTVKSRISRGRCQLRDYLTRRELIPSVLRPNEYE